LKFLIVDFQQVLLLVQCLHQDGLLLRLLEAQSINAVLLKRIDLQLVLHLLARLHQSRIRVHLQSNKVVKRVERSPLLENSVQLVYHFVFNKFLRSHDVPSYEDELFVVVHVVLALPQTEILVLDHVVDDGFDGSGASAEGGSEGQLIGKFLLEGVEQPEGHADVSRHVLGVIGSHADQTHRVYQDFLHLEIS
jgi:hypothetical protein